MAYYFYLDRLMLPVPPDKLQVSIKGSNRTVTLINEGEVNILKKTGLTDISFTALLPNVRYPFAHYNGSFQAAAIYLGALEKLKTQTDNSGKYLPFQFIVSRTMPRGRVLFDTNIKVALEDYKIVDDAKSGFDITVDIRLRQYRSYGIKTVEIKTPTPAQTKITGTVKTQRPSENPPTQKSYAVLRGDSLPSIAQKMFGDRSRYPSIYKLNQKMIDAANKGTGSTKYTVYPDQVLLIP